ncbi:MAG: ribosome recycling factor [Oscillospiraceae bacterium]|nr:ribosome recycling factor [Oscillospiraceae bacterium]MBQ7120559.1 ribosome recycling factor [Oscillospiraceae bacterium]
MRPEVKEFDEKMQKSIASVASEFAAVRAGRANPAVLDKITVDYYGTPTPIPQIGSVAVPEPRTLMIQPWDASVLKLVEKAILASDLGITPSNDGKCIRLSFPQLTEERRRDLTKQVKKLGEDGKVAVRNIRRDALDKFKAMKKKSEITEDDLKSIEDEIQKITDKNCKEIDVMTEKKEKELLEI